MALIELKEVSYTYPNGFTAVENVSFTIDKGEKLAIIGQNGAGKTTTVKMINGLLKPTGGSVLFNGEDTRQFTTAQISRKVGYVFQNPDDQIFNSTVYNEIAYGLKKMRLDPDEIDRRIKAAAEISGISEFLEVNPYDLPFSTRKFLTIASVIASDCEVLIFDEPTAGQDLHGLNILSDLIDDLIKKNKAIITITHDMEFVADNFDRLIVMARKRIIDQGDTHKIFYKKDIMNEAKLRPPVMAQIGESIGMSDHSLHLDDLLSFIKK